MLELADELLSWGAAGTRFALATVVSTWSSSPRPVGASMAVSEYGEVVGSVSGGCVEAALFDSALEVLKTGRQELLRYGVTSDDAFSVGLTCGGTIEVVVQPVDLASEPHLREALAAHQRGLPVAVATEATTDGHAGHLCVIDGDRSGSVGDGAVDAQVGRIAAAMLDRGETALVTVGAEGEQCGPRIAMFVQTATTRPRMLIFGAIDFAAELASVGRLLGYRVTICDARPVFATPERFPDADEVVVQWPHRYLATVDVDPRTVICVLTHDPKFDVPALQAAFKTEAAYIGAMGSRRTHTDRLTRLLAAGVDDADLARLHSPIGLDLGASSPTETAISIAAEIIADRNGRSGARLSTGDTAIHAVPRAPALDHY